MKLVKSMTGTAKNDGDVAQKMMTSAYSESFETSTSVTTENIFHKSHEVSGGATIEAKIDAYFVKFGGSISMSYSHTWGESNSKSNTETKTTTTTITFPSQEVIVNPRSEVNHTANFFSYTDTVHYLFDLQLENIVFFSRSPSTELFNRSILFIKNDLNTIKFETDEVKISCDTVCIVKDVPVIGETTGYHTISNFGKQQKI